MEKTVFQREDGTMSFLRIPLCTAVGTRFRLKARKTERQVPCSFDLERHLPVLYTAYAASRHES